jgi:hypothetical protein
MGHLTHLKKIAVGIGVVTALTAITITPAFAADNGDTSTATASVIAGDRSVNVGDVAFSSTQYQFAAHTIEALGVSMSIVDESGTDGGWQVSMASTDLASDGAATDISATGFRVTAVNNVTPSGPAGLVVGDLATGQVVLAAAASTGAGTTTSDVDFELDIPGGQDIDSYQGTLTTTIVVAP